MDEVSARFLAAYDQYADPLFRFCCAYAGERELARDATQEAFIRTWKYLAAGKHIQDLRPFLYRTARNVIIDLRRRPASDSLERIQQEGFDVPDSHRDPAVSAQASQAIAAMAKLDEKYRTPVILRHVQGLSPGEIAEIVGASENAVSVRINRGMQQLRELLGILPS
jgi:RNA polymerase sigma factor (sigma-70 family)